MASNGSSLSTSISASKLSSSTMSSSERPSRVLPRRISRSNSAKLWKFLGWGMVSPNRVRGHAARKQAGFRSGEGDGERARVRVERPGAAAGRAGAPERLGEDAVGPASPGNLGEGGLKTRRQAPSAVGYTYIRRHVCNVSGRAPAAKKRPAAV